MASNVYVDQTTEIERMQKMLARHSGNREQQVTLRPPLPSSSVPSQESSMARMSQVRRPPAAALLPLALALGALSVAGCASSSSAAAPSGTMSTVAPRPTRGSA